MKSLRKAAVVLMALLIVIPAGYAVLKEQNLSRTLAVLKNELEQDAKKQEEFLSLYQLQHKEQHDKLVDYMKRCEQIGLMLYSQKSDFTFDVAFACQQATDLFKELKTTNMPYDRIRLRIAMDIDRYDSLITILEALPPSINNAEGMFDMDSVMLDSMARIDSVLIDSLGADTLLSNMGANLEKQQQQVLETEKDSLLKNLLDNPFALTKEEQADRLECVNYARSLRDRLLVFLKLLEKDSNYYETVSQQVVKLNDYAQSRYGYLQQSIYKNAGRNYFSILMSLPRYIRQMKRDFTEKYGSFDGAKSEWRGPIILGVSVFMLLYIGIAILLSNVIVRLIPWFMRKFFKKSAAKFEEKISRNLINKEELDKKRLAIMIALGIAIFALAISIVRNLLWSNLLIMAVSLMITVAWLMGVVVVSLLIRLKGDQIRPTLSIYLPFMVMAFIVILFRIVLLPNSLINLFYPPILLVMTFWQWKAQRKYHHDTEHKLVNISDSAFSSISFGAMVIACVCAWIGYTLLAVQIIMWWMFQLAAIQTITCIYDLLQMYEARYIIKRQQRILGVKTPEEIIYENLTLSEKELQEMIDQNKVLENQIKNDMKQGVYFTRTWLYDFINKAVLPVLAVLSILFSIHWAADIFEMASTVRSVFFYNFIDKAGVLQLSLFKLCLVIAVFFVFRYINYAVRSYIYHWYRKARKSTDNMNETLVKNVIAILVWGGYFVFALILLQVPSGGIAIVTGGLATGLGFAMKDLLENFFYGLSLMTGRVRVGDFIECDGIQGQVESITYQSTQVSTIDGSIMAFLNSALFSKNFKNLTRNNNYVLVKIPVGVAYGTDVKNVRKVLLDALKPLCKKTADGRDLVSPEKNIVVAFSDFGASSVDLVVCVWMLVEEKIGLTARAKEAIYNALNKNNIEIPFPQTDVHIK